jgi:hypothetical protein
MKIYRAMVSYTTPTGLTMSFERAVYAAHRADAVALLALTYPYPGVEARLYEAQTYDEFSPGVDLLDGVLGAEGAKLKDLFRARK